ncbi:DUF4344 domain-containing metallopeptidase [Methylobacterium sp. 17Sr1-1]|uniref:DUF4344 domain-containing metallopeptidase n=1 Tax=Methylobacterium sp. 17Sr1-1 TaxID=2202826 RepID=UPI000D7039A9|nr:DUF4344 domain-containing metallopeptidase [Methylobacterium sp. 17Sr1-1]AWN51045.1 hypothetical protein DK412_04375 [Methylobacterium sp. 17Sr1-1]
MRCLLGLAAFLAALTPAGAATRRDASPRDAPIRVAYDPPILATDVAIHRELKRRRVLEGLRTAIGGVRLPHPLTLRLSACGGAADAWYESRSRTVTVCYAYVLDVQARAPAEPSHAGVSRRDAIVGPIAQVFLHEVGHALFDILDVPLLGREEDAADQFAALVLLELPPAQARGAVEGIAHLLRSHASEESVEEVLLADDHGLALQRLYNLLCLAYGADRRTFGDLVESGALPQTRAGQCAAEYHQAAYSLGRLFQHHLRVGGGERTRIPRAFRWMVRP